MPVTRSAILDGMVLALAALVPTQGNPTTADRYVRSTGRFMGRPSVEELFQDGVAGRTPSVQVCYESEVSLRSTTARRFDRVTGTYVAYCITDRRDSRDARASVLTLAEDVRRLIGARSFSLQIRPMRYLGDSLFADTEKVIVYAVRFSTVYQVDHTIDPGNDLMESATGDVHAPNTDEVDGREYGEIDIPLNQETA